MVTVTLYVRHKCKEQTFGLCGRRRGWDDLREWHCTYILPYVKYIACPGLMHETGSSGLVHWDDPKGWGGEGGGSGVQDGGNMYTCG